MNVNNPNYPEMWARLSLFIAFKLKCQIYVTTFHIFVSKLTLKWAILSIFDQFWNLDFQESVGSRLRD